MILREKLFVYPSWILIDNQVIDDQSVLEYQVPKLNFKHVFSASMTIFTDDVNDEDDDNDDADDNDDNDKDDVDVDDGDVNDDGVNWRSDLA